MKQRQHGNGSGGVATLSRLVRPYGLWSSSITASVMGRGIGLDDVRWSRPDADGIVRLVWLERRAGQGIIVASDGDDAPYDVTADVNVRARLGYGGGEFAVTDEDVFFVADGRVHRQPLAGGAPRPLTPAFGQAASPAVSPDGRFVVYVHSGESGDSVAIVDAEGRQWPHKIVQGDDFYMQPVWHPSGRAVAVVAWNQPQMPWDGTQLRLVRLRVDEEDGTRPPTVEDVTVVAGGPDESVFQPEFSPDGRFLAYVSDRTGWWQLHLYDLHTGEHTQLTDGPCEHGQPAWVQGLRTYAFAPDGRSIYFIRNETGFHSVWQCRLDERDGRVLPHNVRVDGFDEYAVLGQIAVTAADGDKVAIAAIASAPDIPPRIVVGYVNGEPNVPATGGSKQATADATKKLRVMRRSQYEQFEPGVLSVPRAVQWYAPDGTAVHGLYYPPANPRFTATGAPPAIINIHGGPTTQALPEFNPKAQWYTSRGYAFLDVNYRGSTGYGRAYRQQLQGRWGIVDVEDAISGADFLVREGLADRKRLVILGGSAGGYTVLRALITKPGFFRAGICLYAVADLFGMATDTHRFEARYTDSLVGPLPEAAELYRELSPVFHAVRIQDPVAVFQGADDPVVPKRQADAIVAALRAARVPHEYHVYEGEGHGWGRAETVEKFYAAVDAFLRKYVVFA